MEIAFNPSDDNYTLDKIKKLCQAKGWSVYRLAKESDIPYSSLNNIFARNTQPTIPTLMSICKGFGITMSEFFQDYHPDDICCRFANLSQDEILLLETYRGINKKERPLLMAYAHGLARKI